MYASMGRLIMILPLYVQSFEFSTTARNSKNFLFNFSAALMFDVFISIQRIPEKNAGSNISPSLYILIGIVGDLGIEDLYLNTVNGWGNSISGLTFSRGYSSFPRTVLPVMPEVMRYLQFF